MAYIFHAVKVKFRKHYVYPFAFRNLITDQISQLVGFVITAFILTHCLAKPDNNELQQYGGYICNGLINACMHEQIHKHYQEY